jgi:hypothetical protein
MARLLQPLIQGDLDGLCGLYSLLNAVQWGLYSWSRGSAKTRHLPKLLSDAEQQALFDTLVTARGKRRPLATFVTGGINSVELTRLLRVSREWLSVHRKADLVFRRPFYRQRTIATRRVLARLGEHLAVPGSAAIIDVEAHWTVVRGAAKRRIRVLDSGGWMFMTIRSKAHRGARRNGFQPSSVFLLRLAPQAGTQAVRP